MGQQRVRRIAAEAILLAVVPAAASLVAAGDPGFLSFFGAPALAIGPLFAGFYGLRWGGSVGLLAAGLAFVAAPAIEGRLDPAFTAALASTLPVPAAISLFALLAAGFFRHRIEQSRVSLLARYRRVAHRASALARETNALKKVNRVLENRVSGQKDSITLLQNQVRKLASLNLDEALVTILETIELFTETRSASIWVPDPESALLVPVAVRGWKEGLERDTTLDPENSIEGYVLRNRKPFSVRMLLDSSEFDRFDQSRNVITMPILIKDKAWGVLNIEDLPFERYSLYTESILAILLSLAEPYLRAITEYESMHAQREVDSDTGFPQFPMLHSILEKELERKAFEPGFVSLFVVEMVNFTEALDRWPRADLKRLLFEVKGAFDEAANTKYQAFHFKGDNQFAFVVPGLDQDGASFLCLDLLTTCSGLELSIGSQGVPLEMIVGFASSKGGRDSPETMIETAEHLLSIQRL
jgi:GGDEF domain-containing protein